MTALLPALAGSNIIYGMGMLELGITLSYSQLLIDSEIVRMIKRILQGMAVNEETLAVEVIKSVGTGGNYLAQQHTAKHMRQEQSRSRLIDRRMRQGWEEQGSLDMAERAQKEALSILENHRPAPLDEAVAKKLREIIAAAESEDEE
jgi:trimethylamine---corrinoid protein Co-methyltransferase